MKVTVPSLVTVLIPARDEAAEIDRCLSHVTQQDHPHDRLEIILVDGRSQDDTVDIARRRLETSDVAWRILENPVGSTPSNLNRGLVEANGTIVCRVDARSFIPTDYVRRCAQVLEARPDVAVVGGAQVAEGVGSSVVERGIVRTLNNRLVMGGARYRSGADSGPDDTVYLGAFRTDQLRSVGGWDEDLHTNQDFELNQRMQRFGMVWFDASIPVAYRPRRSLVSIASQYHRFGRAKVRYWQSQAGRPLARQRRLVEVPAAATGVLTVVLLSIRRPLRSLTGLMALGAAAGLVVDHVGSSAKNGRLAERVVGVAAMVCVAGGWLSGVTRQAIRSMFREGFDLS